MFANLNLQLTTTTSTLDTAIEQPLSVPPPGSPGEGRQSPFSELLGMRVNLVNGEGLPDSGKDLPVFVPPSPPADLSLSTADNQISIDPTAELAPGTDLDLTIDVLYNPTLPESGAHLSAALAVPANDARSGILAVSQAGAAETGRSLRPVVVQSNLTSTLPLGQTAVPVPEILPTTMKQPTADAGIPAGTIKLADMPADNMVAAVVRSTAGLETQRRPGERIASTSSTQTTTPIHLSSTLSSPASDSTSNRSPSVHETISTPVRDAAWGEKLGERILMLSGSQVKTVEIRLTPADLGPLRVQIGIDDGAANVTFHAQHAVTRDAIEQAMPRLREMMAESGLSLGQTDVSEQGVADGKPDRESTGTTTDQPADDESEHQDLSVSDQQRKSVTANNLLDTFA